MLNFFVQKDEIQRLDKCNLISINVNLKPPIIWEINTDIVYLFFPYILKKV